MITDIQIIIYILMFVVIVMYDYVFFMQCRKKYIIVDFYLMPEIILLLLPHYIVFDLIRSVWYLHLSGEFVLVHVKMNLTDFFSFFMLFFIIRMLVNKIKNNTYL
jgi:hypothetical protein